MIYSYDDVVRGHTVYFNDARSVVRCIPYAENRHYKDQELILDLYSLKIEGTFQNNMKHYEENDDTVAIVQTLPFIKKDKMYDGLD